MQKYCKQIDAAHQRTPTTKCIIETDQNINQQMLTDTQQINNEQLTSKLPTINKYLQFFVLSIQLETQIYLQLKETGGKNVKLLMSIYELMKKKFKHISRSKIKSLNILRKKKVSI